MPNMKGRTGFMLGVAAGYVLGARAGRQRYDQIKDATTRISSTEPVQVALETTAEPRSRLQHLVSKGLRATSDLLRDT